MRLSLELQEKKLDDLFKEVSLVKDDEIKSHLSKYLCIKVSGYFENVLKVLISDYVSKSCSKESANYIISNTKRITNLSDEKLTDFLKSFSDKWTDDYNYAITDQHRSSLNSLISNRNSIAHGQQDSISFKIIEQYYHDLKEIVIYLKLIIAK